MLEEGVRVVDVQPNARERTELGGAIQEGERARGGVMHDGEEPLETRQRRTRCHGRNPSHGLGVAGERRGLGAADPAGLEGGGVGDELVNVLHGCGCCRNRKTLVAVRRFAGERWVAIEMD